MTSAVVASPCTQVCRLHPATGWCEGCARSGQEIAVWAQASADERRSILARLPARWAVLVQVHGVWPPQGDDAP